MIRLWSDEGGSEIAEWVLVLALVIAVGIVVYVGVLQTELNAAVEAIGNKIPKP